MNPNFECTCGGEMGVTGDLDELACDIKVECPECGRGYIVTLTRFRGPTVA